jgi:putative Mg2+ transporter-C (MgtC) family protein
VPSNWELAGRILLTMLLSGAVGLEREVTDKTAGLRTHMSVALGACLFGMISAYSFDQFGSVPRNDSSYQVDVTRIASTVVTGVGFLGGGAIVKYGASVRGLTTAGSLWVVAAIGLGLGLGAYFAASMITAALLVALVILRRPVRWLDKKVTKDRETVTITLSPDAKPSGIVDALHELPEVEVKSLTVRRLEERCVIEANLVATGGVRVEHQVAQLGDRDDIAEIDLG